MKNKSLGDFLTRYSVDAYDVFIEEYSRWVTMFEVDDKLRDDSENALSGCFPYLKTIKGENFWQAVNRSYQIYLNTEKGAVEVPEEDVSRLKKENKKLRAIICSLLEAE